MMKLKYTCFLLFAGMMSACESDPTPTPTPETPLVEVEGGFDFSLFSIPDQLCTPRPSVEALNVYRFLKENFGKKLISGAMANVNWNFEESAWIFEQTGKYPVINCLDYIHHIYSPADWIDYEKISEAEFWWKKNGLIAGMWHWNVPSNDGEDFAFYYGSAPRETSFPPSAIANPDSEEYRLLLSDLDQVAGYLKLLRDKNIPVLWRPLHEAAGNTNSYAGGKAWFWWGGEGPEPYIALWRAMYERFVNYHGLNNLIWIWTSDGNDPEWYPGDRYVDIVSCDLYVEKDPHNAQSGTFDKLAALTGWKKIIALSECGGIPDPDFCFAEGAMWSWYMPWYNDYTRLDQYNGATYFKKLMNSPHVITRDQMPNLK